MQVHFVLKSAGLCGGVRVVLEYMYQLIKRGYEAKLYYLYNPPDWFREKIPSQQFATQEDLIAELSRQEGIKIATWFETAYWVSDSLKANDRGYYLIQDIEDSYCKLQHQKEYALNTYKLGLCPITTSKWVQDQLKDKFGQEAALTSLGIDFNVFKRQPEFGKDPNRVLAQCRPWLSGTTNLKGWDVTRKVCEAAFEQDKAISVVTFGMEGSHPINNAIPRIHIHHPSDKSLSEIYNTSGCYLLTSNHEGWSLTAGEAQACGTPVICTNADGNMEFCHHGKTALVADKGDVQTLSDHVLYVIRNPNFASTMADQAKHYIKQYTWDRVGDRLEAELFAKPVTYDPILKAEFITPTNSELEYPVIKDREIDPDIVVSVIIPTVNDYQKTEKCIRALDQNYHNYEIIVVDDGTKDQSTVLELIDVCHDLDVKLIHNNQNLGFSASVNNGIINSSGKHVVLCNNDVTVIGDWLTPMLEVINNIPKVGIVGAKLLYPDNKIQHAGMDKRDNSLYFTHMYRDEARTTEQANEVRESWSVTGALFLITQEALETLGGLSTAYSTAWEDVDYCLNAWTKGFKTIYCGRSEAYHVEGNTRGATDFQKSAKPLMWAQREKAGEAYFMKKWIGLSRIKSFKELS